MTHDHARMISALLDGDEVLAVALEQAAPAQVGGSRPPWVELDAAGVKFPPWTADPGLTARILAEEVLRLRGMSGRQGRLFAPGAGPENT